MGRYDDLTDDELSKELVRFARLVLRMEEEGVLLDRTHSVLRLLGDLRQMVFAHEVRATRRDEPPKPHPLTRMERLQEEAARQEDAPDDDLRQSLRIVREAREQERELLDDLDDDEATES